MDLFRHILLVDRPTQYSGEALQMAVNLAKTLGAKLSVLRLVSNPVDMEAVNAPGLFIKGEEYRTYGSMQQQHMEGLERVIRETDTDAVPIRYHATDESPMEEIRRIVAEQQIDLIVTLGHEEWRLEHLLFGGETRSLVRLLPCSVLLVKREPGPPEE